MNDFGNNQNIHEKQIKSQIQKSAHNQNNGIQNKSSKMSTNHTIVQLCSQTSGLGLTKRDHHQRRSGGETYCISLIHDSNVISLSERRLSG